VLLVGLIVVFDAVVRRTRFGRHILAGPDCSAPRSRESKLGSPLEHATIAQLSRQAPGGEHMLAGTLHRAYRRDPQPS
jgi:hypothetical protein